MPKKNPMADKMNERLKQGDYKRYQTAKPKLGNPFSNLGRAIGNKVSPVKNSGAATKQQLMREYAASKLATKKGALKAKKRAK